LSNLNGTRDTHAPHIPTRPIHPSYKIIQSVDSLPSPLTDWELQGLLHTLAGCYPPNLDMAVERDGVTYFLRVGPSVLEELAPSKSARFVPLLMPKTNREYLLGDIEEEYWTKVLPLYGARKARLWYWKQVVVSLLPSLWNQFKSVARAVLFIRFVI
jgi:hypothetical protein